MIYIINSLGWPRSGNAELFIDYEILPAGKNVRISDLSTGREVPFQLLSKRAEGAYWILQVSDVPAFGAKALKVEVSDTSEAEPKQAANPDLILENKYYRLEVDRKSGAVSSLFDKAMNVELIDNQNPYKAGQLVHETLPDRNRLTPSQSTPSVVKVEKGVSGNVWESIKISADVQGCEKGSADNPKGVEVEIKLYSKIKKVEFDYMARKEIVTDPEALYVAFPFTLPGSRIVFETIGGSLTQGGQLPGSSSDWNVAQNFVSVRGKDGQIVVVSNEIPLWQFSGFNTGKFERYPRPGKTWLYSWVMNNYWFTNFRAFQEGAFRWSYTVTSSADTTNTYATRFAWGERNPYVSRTIPSGNEKAPVNNEIRTLDISGSPNVLAVNSRPLFDNKGSILIHFRETEGNTAEIRLKSLIAGRPVSKIYEVTSVGRKTGDEIQSVRFKPFEVKFVIVEF